MGGYQGQDFSKEFTERTLKVLNATDTIQNEYEATTLVNLALGLIVIPSEYLNGNRRDSSSKDAALKLFGSNQLKEVIQKNLAFGEGSHFDEIEGQTLNTMDYFDFLRLVRNGLAHGLIDFIGNPIQEIRVLNRKRNGYENFRMVISIEEFKYVMQKIALLHLELIKSQQY
jgi:hypothetical protein